MDEFSQMLLAFEINILVDVRHYPGSRTYPHFNKEVLRGSLKDAGIKYEHLESLGGRRKPLPDSKNVVWRHSAFRGYADYMKTKEFQDGYGHLTTMSLKSRTAMMCSEAVWWRCHRSLISDLLKSEGWMVYHINSRTKASEHPYTAPARVVDGKLTYETPVITNLFAASPE